MKMETNRKGNVADLGVLDSIILAHQNKRTYKFVNKFPLSTFYRKGNQYTLFPL